MKTRIAPIAAAFSTLALAGCGTGPSRFANPDSSIVRAEVERPAPRNAQDGRRQASPFAGSVVDRVPGRFQRCNPANGQVYEVELSKVINLNGQIDTVETPVSMTTGFNAKVDPISCGFINGMSGAVHATYSTVPKGSGANGLYNNVPTISNNN
ncbi:MAG: hypothetical protein H6865_06695 [Rhodospirillales bacterium]|nr:hypothetical protein [Alphaproteobacteria bacterium]MCB9987308.1 hypothetical protein [Rhodospirillales bacterium]USO07836.1 MAG: hypothetical protein H6866_01005 [Rhodospirillales bacterium]